MSRPRPIQAYRNALGLTPAQARVLRRRAIGRSVPDIASELRNAQRTVHNHLQRTYRTLGVKTASDALVLTDRRRRVAERPPNAAAPSPTGACLRAPRVRGAISNAACRP